MKVKDFMNRSIISILPDTPVKNVFNTFLKHNSPVIPVIDKEQHLVGFIIEETLIERVIHYIKEKTKDTTHIHMNPEKFVETQKLQYGLTAADLISKDILTIDENDDILDAMNLFIKHNFHSLPVIRRDKLIGFITHFEALKAAYYFEEINKFENKPLTDEEITFKVYSALKDNMGLILTFLKVRTYKGEVYLQGSVATPKDSENAGKIAASIPGVKHVINTILIENILH